MEALSRESRQQANNSIHLATSNSLNCESSGRLGGGSGSGNGLGSTSRGVSSFPLGGTITVDVGDNRLGGAPMRRQNSATSASSTGRASSPEKRLSTGMVAGRQDSFFKDLNPLS